jgi:flagellar basal body-associated protein FliL
LSKSTPLKDLITQFFDEVKAAIKEYAQKQEAALKQRIKKLLVISIVSTVLLSIAITTSAAASLFFLIGFLRYLETFLPPWQAWMVIGVTSTVAAAALFGGLAIIIKKQTSTPKEEPATTINNPQGTVT